MGGWRWPALFAAGFLAVSVVFAGLAAVASAPDVNREFSVPEMESQIRNTYDFELQEARRRRRADGQLGVVDVECQGPGRPGDDLLCLIHVAAVGEARRIVPVNTVIRVRRDSTDGFEFSTPHPRPAGTLGNGSG